MTPGAVTHEVLNQVPPFVGYDTADDATLLDGLTREGAGWAVAELPELGRLSGGAQALEWGRLANAYPPVLRSHDLSGYRVDEVEFHPAWHELMRVAVRHGLHAAPWADDRPGAHVARAARFYVWRPDAGHGCPISMTYAAVPALRHAPELAARYEPLLTATEYDVPRVLPDGTRNAMHLMRLKDKLGNRSNASAEVEYAGAGAWRVGEEGRGVRTIIDMVNLTRLDCVIGAAAGMRQGLTMAVHHTTHRRAFGRYLVDQPLMRNVLADLTVESEAATLLMLRLAGATDRAARGDQTETAVKRLALAVGKYWVCKRAPGHAAEVLECLGGNGYVEESGAPRLFRESPLSSIWEGAGNVAALDVLRAIGKEPDVIDAYRAELSAAAGADHRLDAAVRQVEQELKDPDELELRARRVAERLALVLQGALLVRYGHPAVADAFCASRLGGDHGGAYGTLPPGVDFAAILARSCPE